MDHLHGVFPGYQHLEQPRLSVQDWRAAAHHSQECGARDDHVGGTGVEGPEVSHAEGRGRGAAVQWSCAGGDQ